MRIADRVAKEHGIVESSHRINSGRKAAAVEAREAVPLAEWVAPAKQNAVAVAIAEPIDRRSRLRAKVNFFACVRSDRFGEDVAPCIDMSKGGVSFRARKLYEKDMRIEIAVPFAADVREAPAISVLARIAHVQEDGHGSWKCGV